MKKVMRQLQPKLAHRLSALALVLAWSMLGSGMVSLRAMDTGLFFETVEQQTTRHATEQAAVTNEEAMKQLLAKQTEEKAALEAGRPSAPVPPKKLVVPTARPNKPAPPIPSRRTPQPLSVPPTKSAAVAGTEIKAPQENLVTTDATAAKKELGKTVTPTSLPAKAPTKLDILTKQFNNPNNKMTLEQFNLEKIGIDQDEKLAALGKRPEPGSLGDAKFMSKQSEIRSDAENQRADTLKQGLPDKQKTLAGAHEQLNTAKTSQDTEKALQSITSAQNAVDKVTASVEGAKMNARRFAIDQKTAKALDDVKSAKPEDIAEINKTGGIDLQKDMTLQKGLEIDRLTAQAKRMDDDIVRLTKQKGDKLQGISSRTERTKITKLFDKEIELQKNLLTLKQAEITTTKEALKTASDELIVTQAKGTLRDLNDTLATARTQLGKAKTSQEINTAFKSITQAQKDLEAATIAAEDASMNVRRAEIKRSIAQNQDKLEIAQGLKTTTKKELVALEQQIKDGGIALKNDNVVQANIKIARLESQIKDIDRNLTDVKIQQGPKSRGGSSREEQGKIFDIFSKNTKFLTDNLEDKRLLYSKEHDVLNIARNNVAKAQKEATATWWQRMKNMFSSKK